MQPQKYGGPPKSVPTLEVLGKSWDASSSSCCSMDSNNTTTVTDDATTNTTTNDSKVMKLLSTARMLPVECHSWTQIEYDPNEKETNSGKGKRTIVVCFVLFG
jgi:hypothetical protein